MSMFEKLLSPFFSLYVAARMTHPIPEIQHPNTSTGMFNTNTHTEHALTQRTYIFMYICIHSFLAHYTQAVVARI